MPYITFMFTACPQQTLDESISGIEYSEYVNDDIPHMGTLTISCDDWSVEVIECASNYSQAPMTANCDQGAWDVDFSTCVCVPIG